MSVRRRAFTMLHTLVLLPLISVLFGVGFQLVSRTMSLQSVEARLSADEAKIHDLSARVRRDAGKASQVRLSSDSDATVLELPQAEDAVTYRVRGHEIIRVMHPVGRPAMEYRWVLDYGQIDFRHELIEPGPGVIWILSETVGLTERGPEQKRRLATAVRVGREGVR